MKKIIPNLSLRNLLLTGIGISMVIIIIVLSIYIFNSMAYELREQEVERLNAVSKTVDNKLDDLLAEGRVAVNLVAKNTAVQSAFADRDRELLREMLLTSYQDISSEMAQFQFHLPDSTSFLRLHSPEKYGDDLSSFRFTVNQANENQEMVTGIEEGRGGYGLRVVSPVEYEGEHLGTVEFGVSMGEKFLTELQNDFSGEYYIYSLADKNSVAWDEDNSDWIASTTNSDPYQVSDRDLKKVESGENVIKNTGNYNLLLIPFRDYNNQVSGFFKLAFDRSQILNTYNTLVRNTAVISLIGIILTLIITFLVAKKIFDPLEKFEGMFAALALGNLNVSY
ncbi:MAG: cache domain-containing protein, partial [Halanaerobium sp.]